MKYTVFENAINEATAGLKEIEAEARRLSARKERLEAAIRGLLALLPLESEEPRPAVTAAQLLLENNESDLRKAAEAEEKFTWMWARDVLARSEVALTVPQIHKILAAGAQNDEAIPAQDALRIAMLRKPDIFIKRDRRYGLTSSQFEVIPVEVQVDPQEGQRQ